MSDTVFAAQSEKKSRRSVSTPDLLVGVGFGFCTAWVSVAFRSIGMYGDYANAEYLLDTQYLISIIALTLTFVLSGVFHQYVARIIGHPASHIVMPLGVAVSTLGMPFAGWEGVSGIALGMLTGVGSGVFSGLQLLIFGSCFAQLKTRSMVTVAALSQVVSLLLFALSQNFAPFETVLFAASVPCAAALLLHFGMKDRSPDELNEVVPLTEQQPLDSPHENKAAAHLIFRVSLSVLLIGFANEAVRTFLLQLETNIRYMETYARMQMIIAFLVTVGVVLISLAVIGSGRMSRSRVCYQALTLMLAAGVLLLFVPLIYDSTAALVPFVVNSAAYSCFGMFIWVVIAAICRHYSSIRVRALATIRGAWAAGPLVGFVLTRLLITEAGSGLQTAYPIVVLSMFAVILAVNVVFTGSVLLEALEIIPVGRRQRFQEKCQIVAGRFRLTERECEIMTLFAKGRNLAYIQNELHLSKSTVSTHRQHIYQKLGVHSAQEMIDLVQDADV